MMMLRNAKLLSLSAKFQPSSTEPPHNSRRTNITVGTTPSSLERDCKLSRRNLSKSSLLLLLSTQTTLTPLLDFSKAQAEDTTSSNPNNPTNCGNRVPTTKAFVDVSIDGEPIGRIIIGLYGDDVPAGTARFTSIVSGKAGISYRRKEFVKIMPGYVQHGGIRSYGVDAERATAAVGTLQNLIEEWERGRRGEICNENKAGSVGIVVRDPSIPPPKTKLVARNGKLAMEEEVMAVGPNGTEFVITAVDSPELEDSVLVIGKVLEGMGVVEKIREVKTVRDNTSSPYFRVAKVIGDKRAVVAERGFNRPYSKVVVTNCGLIESQTL
ncbi:PREDICTED: peptidyl-prolyl cis-trans isomerase CYP26-2, chloroplastic-like [Camelina sativa]|uniref:Peptidyl-prolyl cis-trans isomerase CYP26-2, chloroplastic-like n=1 Tax=Camelina sativa TaxID=90675 RepID=A0ABM0SUB0_CAMSA|nr:PREDICTED: peptidyl-prolyl cis-trans isomerase CYP26-2, chloroplastic-like [Camelina sativa]